MRNALLRDLSDIPEVYLTTAFDYRLSPPAFVHQAVQISEHEDIWDIWVSMIAESDAVWLIAPETDGLLLKLTQMVEEQGKVLLGCHAYAVEVASSKYKTWQVLSNAGVEVIPTDDVNHWQPNIEGSWVVKPDDGTDCEGSLYFETSAYLTSWLSQKDDEALSVVQPYQRGCAASISMLCKDGDGWLLSCNSQKINLEVSQGIGKFSYSGSIVNGLAEHWALFEDLAKRIAKAIPSLRGYVGIDVIMDELSRDLHVLEINPRLTTSYVGLRQAIGYNPARLVVDLLYNDAFSLPPISRNIVEISLNA